MNLNRSLISFVEQKSHEFKNMIIKYIFKNVKNQIVNNIEERKEGERLVNHSE